MSCGPGEHLRMGATTVLLLLFAATHVFGKCPSGFYECSDHSCIREAKHCDHRKDCPDGGDEFNCDNVKCKSPMYWKCEDGRCIQTIFKCDGNNDCGDWSDEWDCHLMTSSIKPCQEGEFSCGDGFCIQESWVCDGLKDCRDGSDEVLGCSRKLDCGQDFRCSNHHCIPKEWLCDGNDDCGDDSDEVGCKSKDVTVDCTLDKSLFPCNDKQKCIELAEVCDGTKHCTDGSDESPICQKSRVSCSGYGCSYKCQPTPSGPVCLCPLGFNIMNDKYCEDINECMIYGICSQKCKNTHGSYECFCDEGYTLQQMDNHTCTVNDGEAVLVFSTKKEVRAYFMTSQVYSKIAQNQKHIVGVAYDGLHVYWTSLREKEESLLRTNTDGTGTEVLVSSGLSLPEDLAVDLVTGNIYFTDGEESYVGVCTNSGDECTVLVKQNVQKPRAIALLPRNGTMFWTDWGDNPKIATAGMDGSSPKQFVTEVHWPNGITIDLGNDRLYWVDAKLMSIESTTLDGTDRRIILKYAVKHPYAIAVFENTLYWSDWDDKEIASCHKFTGKNHKVIVRSTKSHIYGLKIYHPALHPVMKNPCEDAGCSDMCLLAPNNMYTCGCPIDKELGVDKHSCTVIHKKELIIAAAGNHLIEVEHKLLGKQSYSVMVAHSIKNINAITYSSVDDLLIVSDSDQKKLYTMVMSTHVIKPLIEQGIGKITSLEFDPYGNNLYWTDSERSTVEAMSMNTKTVAILMRSAGAEPPIGIAVVPDEGYMFIAFNSLAQVHIVRMFMDGSGKRVHTMEEQNTPHVSLWYDGSLSRIFVADPMMNTIKSLASDGIEHHIFKKLSLSPASVASASRDLFWTVYGTNDLYWSNKFFGDAKVKKIPLLVGEVVENIVITAVGGVVFLPNHPCHQGNGGCSHLCLMRGMQHVCGCPDGMFLLMDNYTCLLPVACKRDEFRCEHDRKCIPASYRCNGVKNCPSGEDEKGCVSCHKQEFSCNNGQCIPSEMKCDGVVQCSDGTDERNCNGGACDPGADFECRNGRCIAQGLQCNLMDDCDDGSDEENCDTVTCRELEFRCRSGSCIPNSWLCDGDINCPDETDEQECPTQTCNPEEFTCANGHCVDTQLTCNTVDDCGDYSDEKGCEQLGSGNVTCTGDEFSCSSWKGLCIPLKQRCDGKADCPKAEDERDCSCNADQFECKNGKCIAIAWVCDRVDDCGDSSDEDTARCVSLHEEGETCEGFECPSGKCLYFKKVCDGFEDCEDGSDEGGKCSKACADHPCGGECQATPAGPHCSCVAGYRLKEDGKTCSDVDECIEHVCSQHCTNTPGSFYCSCLPDYVLRLDRVSCKAKGPAMEYIFVTGKGQIRKVSHTLSHVEVVHRHAFLTVTGLDVDTTENSICWSTRHTSTIYCQSLDTHNRTYVEDIGHPTEVAVDWITKNVYYVNDLPGEESYIQVCHMAEKLCAVLLSGEHGNEINNIAVDPLAGLLFWTEIALSMDNVPMGSIHRADLAGASRMVLAQSKLGLVSGIALNTVQRIVYWTDESAQVVESATYEGDKRTVLFTTEVKRPKRLVLFEDDLFWIQGHYGFITKCRLFGKANRCENLHINVHDADYLTITQQSRQRGGHNPCEYNRCSHLCTVTPHGAKCVCEDGQVVNMNVPCKTEGAKIPVPRFTLPGVIGGAPNTAGVEVPSGESVQGRGWSITAILLSVMLLVCLMGAVYCMYRRKVINLRVFDFSIHFRKPGNFARGAASPRTPSLRPGEHEYVNPLQMVRSADASAKKSSLKRPMKKIRAPSQVEDFSDSESEHNFPIGSREDEVRLIA